MRLLKTIQQSIAGVTAKVMTSIALFVFLFLPLNTHAAGLLIADGGFGGVLEIREHDVKVTINNGIAVTDVTQVFLNTENRQVEALYTFPVPRGASVANFSMWINGKEMIGEVVEKNRAREIYDSYKQKRQDPGLLEQVDYKTFEMRIFPINAGAEQKVQISYYQELDMDHDRGAYVYPLATVTRSGIDANTTGRFAIHADVKSAIPITDIESPSHGDAFAVARHSENYWVASLETSGGSLASDVVLNYGISRPVSGMDLITSRQPGEDGYFCMTITAGKELAEADGGMDYVFVLDVSGSMANDGKLVVSKNALEAFVAEIGEKDRFEVMSFNVSPNILFGELKSASGVHQKAARIFMAGQKARGGTELAPAMTAAYKYGNPDRPLNVVILSDGMTEQKERRILLQMIQSRPENVRVFCIGIGNEVNRPLLEQMAEDSGGLAAFISGGDDFKRAARGFRRKLMRPVATDLRIDVDGVRVYDVEPSVLPGLFHGSPIRIYGRYSGGGEGRIRLSGNIQGVAMSRSASLMFPENDSTNPEIERMWAWKRVDQLLKQADRTGSRDRVLDEIIRLGEEYSIVTEYTSFLVLENDAEYQRWRIERRNARRMSGEREARAKRQIELDLIKKKAAADIGPRDPAKDFRLAEQALPSNSRNMTPSGSPLLREPDPGQSRDLNFGSGPVGPLFAVAAFWLRRRRMKKQTSLIWMQ
ncbi:MAG: VWA domain-containing protein [Desulfobacteraceae bacterium]|jgi:Ca-activated chloride channel family protein|nr:MAG: VWA domain-containing protein [Desulfobacteraceae bacterium]